MSTEQIHLSRGTEDPQRRTPWESLVLACAGVAPIMAGAAACLLLPAGASGLAMRLTIIWSGAVLCFLSGVRRGLAFRQPGGPLLTQITIMLWLFSLGIASLLSPSKVVALALQIAGYATMAVADPISADKGEAPRYFKRLRPIQMLLPVIALGMILGRLAIG